MATINIWTLSIFWTHSTLCTLYIFWTISTFWSLYIFWTFSIFAFDFLDTFHPILLPLNCHLLTHSRQARPWVKHDRAGGIAHLYGQLALGIFPTAAAKGSSLLVKAIFEQTFSNIVKYKVLTFYNVEMFFPCFYIWH